MNKIDELLDLIRKDKRCEVLPPSGSLLPLSDDTLRYPDDVIYFYQKCNGIKLFYNDNSLVSFTILPNDEILNANMVIVGELCEYDISSTWYLIAKTDNNDYLSIDLSLERNGRCYDSNYEVHGVAGSCPIIALNFTELLVELYNTGGKDVFWKNKDHGDAYD
ncbi:SMI1/KNR4 family protein [Cronobacter turicensis]|nr:SMI1/KNR4 family protein [Cronobacter turicensis]